eukprot:CAMPEP_0196671410 /NCGR_PEP_ID=MMETSP1090-20130531/1791_1 /TAXON_ID=37098 /ORGANISM="Isochrysis sp, Strain CCMP1244" /LENGTH=147 /DNA_ID=CAMNT_0042009067 /DNA_START=41 /DNA_END=484 /DNA_ORIENTATION=-
MPHGDFSDLSALVHFALGGIMCARPELLYQPFPPNAILRPFFDAPPEVERPLSAEMEVMLRFCGGFAIILGCALFTVRWNTLNGKLTGLGFCGAGANLAHATFAVLDHEVLVPRPFYLVAAWLALTGVKLMFFANPMLKTVPATKYA